MHSTDEIFKASAYLTETYASDAKTRQSRELIHTPFNRAFGTDAGYFAWLEGAKAAGENSTREQSGEVSGRIDVNENMFRLTRFGKAMMGTAGWEKPVAIFQGKMSHVPLLCFTETHEYVGFDWASLPHDSVVVDVGGGVGSTSMLLAGSFPHLKFVVQEREVVVELGQKV